MMFSTHVLLVANNFFYLRFYLFLFFYYLAMNDFVLGKLGLGGERRAALLADLIAFSLPDPLNLNETTAV